MNHNFLGFIRSAGVEFSSFLWVLGHFVGFGPVSFGVVQGAWGLDFAASSYVMCPRQAHSAGEEPGVVAWHDLLAVRIVREVFKTSDGFWVLVPSATPST